MEDVRGSGQRLSHIPSELGLGKDAARVFVPNLVCNGANVLGVPGERERLAAQLEDGEPAYVEVEAVSRAWRAARFTPAAGVDEAPENRVHEDESGDVPAQFHARHVLYDLRLDDEVDARDQPNIVHRPEADISLRQ